MNVVVIVLLSLVSWMFVWTFVECLINSFSEFFETTVLWLILNIILRIFALVYPFTLIAWYLIK